MVPTALTRGASVTNSTLDHVPIQTKCDLLIPFAFILIVANTILCVASDQMLQCKQADVGAGAVVVV